jgi:hypothetical protein
MTDMETKTEISEPSRGRGRRPAAAAVPFAFLVRAPRDVDIPGRTIRIIRHDGEKTIVHVGQYGQETESRISDAVHYGYQMASCEDAAFEKLWEDMGGTRIITKMDGIYAEQPTPGLEIEKNDEPVSVETDVESVPGTGAAEVVTICEAAAVIDAPTHTDTPVPMDIATPEVANLSSAQAADSPPHDDDQNNKTDIFEDLEVILLGGETVPMDMMM